MPQFTMAKGKDLGFSLIEALVMLLIMTITAMAILTLLINQNRESNSLKEKLASLDFTRVVSSILLNPTACGVLLNSGNVVGGTTSLTFDATSVSASHPYLIDLVQISGVIPGESVSAISPSLILNPANGLRLSVTSPTTANLLVNFDQTKLTRPLKNLSFPVLLDSSGATNNTTILGCSTGHAAASSLCGSGPGNGEGSQRYNSTGHFMEYCNGTSWTRIGGVSYCTAIQSPQSSMPSVVAQCPQGYILTGGGCWSSSQTTIVAGGGPGVSGDSGTSPTVSYICYNHPGTPVLIVASAICCR